MNSSEDEIETSVITPIFKPKNQANYYNTNSLTPVASASQVKVEKSNRLMKGDRNYKITKKKQVGMPAAAVHVYKLHDRVDNDEELL